MKGKFVKFFGIGVVLIVALGLILTVSDVFAQPTMKKIEKPNLDRIQKICPKPDLTNWKDNLPLGTKSEFPFESQCKNCYLELGAMKVPTMSMWISNKGTNAPASKAKLSWTSAKPPYQMDSITVNVPAINAGQNHLLEINVPQGKYFQISKPIKLELDSAKQLDECNENNNTFTFNYPS